MSTTAPTCVICRREYRDAHACRGCVDRILADLAAVPDLLDELDTTVSRQDRHARSPGRSAETPLAYRWRPAQTRDTLRNLVGTWARDLADDRHIDLPRTHGDAARLLRRWPTWIAQHPAADELAAGLHSAVGAARRAIDQPADRRVFLGRCDLSDPDNPPCPAEVWAPRGRDTATCDECGADWSVRARQLWLAAQVQHETATAEVLAGFLTRIGVEVTPRDVQDAARRGEISNVGIDSHTKRRRYQVSDVLDRFLPGRRDTAA